MRRLNRKRTIFIGDVHGCLTELKDLVHEIKPTSLDRVILLGDMINRGPHQPEVVRYVYEKGFECLLGNHEYHYVSAWRHNKKYREIYENIGFDIHKWILRLPSFIETPQFIAVHAGLEPNKHPSKSPVEILSNIRTWDGVGQDLRNPKNPPWYEFYKGEKPVFYGHWAKEGLNIRENTIGLDSGCVYGNALSAYILETRSLIQVQSLKVYEQVT